MSDEKVFNEVTVTVERSDHYLVPMNDLTGGEGEALTLARFKELLLAERSIDQLVAEWCLLDMGTYNVWFTLVNESGDREYLDVKHLFDQARAERETQGDVQS